MASEGAIDTEAENLQILLNLLHEDARRLRVEYPFYDLELLSYDPRRGRLRSFVTPDALADASNQHRPSDPDLADELPSWQDVQNACLCSGIVDYDNHEEARQAFEEAWEAARRPHGMPTYIAFDTNVFYNRVATRRIEGDFLGENAHRVPFIVSEAVREELRVDPGGFRHHVAILKRDGYLESEDGTLRPSFEEGAAEEYDVDDIEFTIRPARQADLSGIVGAIRQVTEEMTYVVAETVADELDHEDVLLRHNELESRMFFVATVEDEEQSGAEPSDGTDVRDEVVGWAHLHAPELEKLNQTAELTVGVLEGYRERGIGSQLLERALAWADEQGYEKLYQSVPSTNERAIEFFEERGWQVEAVRENHYKLGDEYIDEVMMALVVS